VGGEGQVVAARQARGTREDVVRVVFCPKCSPNLGPVWGAMGCPGGGHRFGGNVGCSFWPNDVRLDKKGIDGKDLELAL
jgi:hypothetical protein